MEPYRNSNKTLQVSILLFQLFFSNHALSTDCLHTGVVANFENTDSLPTEENLYNKNGGIIFKSILKSDQDKCSNVLDHSLREAYVQFQGGSDTERAAWIGLPPVDGGSGKALAFRLQKPYISNSNHILYAGRAQLNIYNYPAAKYLNVSVRMLLPTSFNKLSEYPDEFKWLTLSEWWNNASWLKNEPHPFRITLNLAKINSNTGSPLRFIVTSEIFDKNKKKWLGDGLMSSINTTFHPPIGRWITMQYTIIDGDNQSGQFRLDITEDGGPTVNVFDLHGMTHHPRNLSSDGFTHFNPIKLYTTSRLIDFMRLNGDPLTVWWDDLQINSK